MRGMVRLGSLAATGPHGNAGFVTVLSPYVAIWPGGAKPSRPR